MSKHTRKLAILASTTLTANYVATSDYRVDGGYQLVIGANYTPKAAQTNRIAYIKVEFSGDDTTYYQETSYTVSGASVTHSQGEHLFTGATGGTSYKYVISVPIAANYVRISFKEDGASNFGTLALDLLVSEEI